MHDLGEPDPPPARIVDPLDVEDMAAGLVAVLTDDILRDDLAARGSLVRVGAHLAGRGRRARTTVEAARVSATGPLALSLDVSAVPTRPGGAGRYTIALARGLAAHPDVTLTLVARRSDASRWEAVGAQHLRAEVPTSRPGRLAFEQVGLPSLLRSAAVAVHHGPHYTMPARSPVPCAVTIHDCTFFDHPEWHLRTKAGVLPAGHPTRRPSTPRCSCA